MNVISAETTFHGTPLESIFKTSKKTIQEYVREIDRHRYKSIQSQVTRGVVLDDRGPLIDLYEACVEQDAHLRAVLETVESQIIGERYMLARQNERGKYIKDVEETKKIQGSQFTKIIKGIVEAKWYGYTLLEIMPDAERILREVPDTVPEYGEAKRLLKFLDNFIPIDPAEIPPTSLLREFIGGSSFRY